MLKKMGVVTAGVTAGLLAAAPFASATECHSEHHSSHKSSETNCSNEAGDASAVSEISGDSGLGNIVGQAPIGGSNALNFNCNKVLNDNLSHNDITLVDLGDLKDA